MVDPEKRDKVLAEVADLTFLARCAHQADRYDEMTRFLYDVIELHEEINEEFSAEQRYMLTVAYKNHIGPF
jgi:14-3-3 protein epsilon